MALVVYISLHIFVYKMWTSLTKFDEDWPAVEPQWGMCIVKSSKWIWCIQEKGTQNQLFDWGIVRGGLPFKIEHFELWYQQIWKSNLTLTVFSSTSLISQLSINFVRLESRTINNRIQSSPFSQPSRTVLFIIALIKTKPPP